MKKLVLASASPRRKELLSQIGLDFIVCPSDAEEVITKTVPAEIVMELAKTKAEAIWQKTEQENCIVLGADTIVVKDDEILGKPKDDQDAARMIQMLQGCVHQVYTGVCFYYREEGTDIEKCHLFYGCTDVQVAPMSRQEIATYLQQGEHRDKAGAYGIQGFFERYIEGIRGDYANVVGLPVGLVYRELIKLGLIEA
ncbi:MAG: septum formation protein Maf [Lachnospiraceae bacterium]|nr:septum formation protein Maf [Lachnospiraceae bacterium]